VTAGTLVDSNVILDIFTTDPTWHAWSSDALIRAADSGPLYINPIVYAEVSTHFTQIEDLDNALPASDYRRAPVPWPAAFLAQTAFVRYRRRGGAKATTLPDFFIGAHAAVAELDLLTRDAQRIRTYFPTVRLRTPD
jgi:predicted nucleic acid-binding protein